MTDHSGDTVRQSELRHVHAIETWEKPRRHEALADVNHRADDGRRETRRSVQVGGAEIAAPPGP